MAHAHVFELVPYLGVGPLHLGITLADANASVGRLVGATPSATPDRSRGTLHHFFDAAFQFELGDFGRVHFVGVAHHPRLLCRYEGRDVFDLPAPRLFALVASREAGTHRYRSDEYLFPDQIVTLYEADERHDPKGGRSRPVWGQVGVAKADYVRAVRDVRQRRRA